MEVRAAPSFTSSPDAISATCRIVVSFDWSSTRYFLPDHLGSTNVVTDASGTVIQLLDYYPYGSTRINQTTNNFNEGKQFIGRYSDPETNLSYLQARYYDGSKGEFLSEDPVFWEIGQTREGINALSNPQAQNSYSYANNNPITNKDPNGRASVAEVRATLIIAAAALTLAAPYLPASMQPAISHAVGAIGQMTQSMGGSGTANFKPTRMITANPYPVGVRTSPTIVNTPYTKNNVPWASVNLSTDDSNPFLGPVSEPVIIVDPNGNSIPVNQGEKIDSSPDGKWMQVKDSNGDATGVRIDGGHSPAAHPDPRSQQPHAHVPGVTNPDGTPWLPINQ